MHSLYRYQQLEQWIISGIHQQRWRTGEKIPSIRALCKEHQVSISTAQHALLRLETQGLIKAKAKSGYYVAFKPQSKILGEQNLDVVRPKLISQNDLWLDIMQRSASFDLLPALHSGNPPPGIIALNRSIARSLRRQQGDDHQYYDDPAGDPALRQQLVLQYARRGWLTRIDQLCITSGCQHSLFLALMSCCEPGDTVAVESPCFYGVLQLLQQLKLQVIEVPSSSDEGLRVDTLDEILTRWKVTACVVSPNFSTPSGAQMPLSAQKTLLSLAEKHNFAIIEDDIYSELTFGSLPEPLKSTDLNDRVILCSSFSKSLSRDLRIGWISGGRWHHRILQLKLINLIASSRFVQQGLAQFMEDGGLNAHLRRHRAVLQQQRDRLLSVINQWEIPIKYSIPKGGLTLWLELPTCINTMQSYFIALNEGITLTPGALFSVSQGFQHCLRLSFAHHWDDKRINALNRLPDIIQTS